MSLAFFAVESDQGPCVACESPIGTTVQMSCPSMAVAEVQAMQMNREQQARDRITQRAPAYFGQRKPVRYFENEDVHG